MFIENNYFENFSFDNPTMSLTVIIWAVCIGLAVAVVAYAISRHTASLIVKAIAKNECYSPESAKTFAELGLKPTLYKRHILRDGTTLRKYVSVKNPEECALENKTPAPLKAIRRFFAGGDAPLRYDLNKAIVYIPEDVRHTAEIRYEEKKADLIIAIVSALLFIALAFGLTLTFPKLLELWDAAITRFKNL